MLENAVIIFAYIIFFLGMLLLLGTMRAEKRWTAMQKESWLVKLLGMLAGGEGHESEEPLVKKKVVSKVMTTLHKMKKADTEEIKVEGEHEEMNDIDTHELDEVTLITHKITKRKGMRIWVKNRLLNQVAIQVIFFIILTAFLIFLYALIYIGTIPDKPKCFRVTVTTRRIVEPRSPLRKLQDHYC